MNLIFTLTSINVEGLYTHTHVQNPEIQKLRTKKQFENLEKNVFDHRLVQKSALVRCFKGYALS